MLRAFLIAAAFVALLAPMAHGQSVSENNFKDNVIFNHFDADFAKTATIGIEIEMGGISANVMIELIKKHLGGTNVETIRARETYNYKVHGTIVGTIEVQPNYIVTPQHLNIRANRAGLPNVFSEEQIRKFGDNKNSVEIATSPMNYEQTQVFAQFLDAISEAGAKGTSTLRPVSAQVSTGVDPKDGVALKNLLANYYGNAEVLRRDANPTYARQPYLKMITDEFMAKLSNALWRPTMRELYEEYIKGSPLKASRLNIMNALLMDPENFKRFEQPIYGIPAMPRAEFREANFIASTEQDQTRASRHLMREVDFALSLTGVSKQRGDINARAESVNAIAKIRQLERTGNVRAQTFRESLRPEFVVGMKVKPIENASVVVANAEALTKWGISGSQINEQLLAKYGLEVDHTEGRTGTTVTDTKAPFATAHIDGFGGIGDGRALYFDEVNGISLNGKGTGLTPYVLKRYSSWLGFHIGGVDGFASMTEGLRSYLIGEALNAFGIPSERVVGVIETNKISVSDFQTDPSVLILRELPAGGIRNSHLRAWNPEQTRQGLDYLKSLVTSRTGTQMTDISFMNYDIVKTAEIAARMQDLYIVHGALSPGNVLAAPAVVDLNTVRFAELADPEFTPLGRNSSFGNQAGRLMSLALERRDRFAKASPLLKTINVEAVFQESFQAELSRLSLKRLGLENSEVEKLMSERPELVRRYSEALWAAQMNHLKTDFREFQARLVQYHEGLRVGGAILPLAKEYSARIGYNPEIAFGASNQRMQKFKNWYHGRHSEIPIETAQQLATFSLEIIGSLKPNAEKLERMIRNARVMADRRPTNGQAVESAIKEVVTARKNGQSMKEALKKLDGVVTELKDRAAGNFTKSNRASRMSCKMLLGF